MFDELQKWPNPVDTTNWKAVDLSFLVKSDSARQSQRLPAFTRLLESLKTGLELYEQLSDIQKTRFSSTFDQLLQKWIEICTHIYQTSTQQPQWLIDGYFSFNGTQIALWTINSDPNDGGYTLSQDGNIITDIILSKDFGALFELGNYKGNLSTLVKGGANSVLTKASISKIESVFDEKEKNALRLIDTATKERASEIKALEGSKGWSEHYDGRVSEYEGLVAKWQKARSWWFLGLSIVLLAYGVAIFLVATKAILFDGLSSLNGFSKYIVGFTFYGVLAGAFLGYGFAARQLKVSQNLLEQYRHRSIVAKTIENIVGAVIRAKGGEDDGSTNITQNELNELVRVAALAMFEHRSIGYLSTKEGNGGLLGELFGRNN